MVNFGSLMRCCVFAAKASSLSTCFFFSLIAATASPKPPPLRLAASKAKEGALVAC